jgi:hypothetical protein
MAMESAPEAQRGSFAPTPTGFRRLTPSLLKVDRTAESFAGLPDGVTVHGQLLAAFKAAHRDSACPPAWYTPSTGCSDSRSRRTGGGEGGRSSGPRLPCRRTRLACPGRR